MRIAYFFPRLKEVAIKVGLKAIKAGFKKWPPKVQKSESLTLPAKKSFSHLFPKFSGVSGKASLLFERQFSDLAVIGCIDYLRRGKKINYDKLRSNKVFLRLAYRRALGSFVGFDFDRAIFTSLAFGHYNSLVEKLGSSKHSKYKLGKDKKLNKKEFFYITSIYFHFMDYLFGYFDEYLAQN
ncbi:MAG: hypothetical protein QXT97_02020 [Candidatus Diapherotrites archaeon]